MLERHVFCRLVDPALQIVLAFERRPLARHEAQHHPLLCLRHEPQRLEPAGAGVVIFEKEAVDRELAEQRLGDMVVSALGHPGRAEIAAAHMRADGHAGRLAGERLVDQADVDQVLVLAVPADAVDVSALCRVVEIGEACVIKLQVGATQRREAGDLPLVYLGEVIPEGIDVGISGLIDHRPAAAVMQHRRRRDR